MNRPGKASDNPAACACAKAGKSLLWEVLSVDRTSSLLHDLPGSFGRLRSCGA